jgi:hypothetical protein
MMSTGGGSDTVYQMGRAQQQQARDEQGMMRWILDED